MDWGENSKCWVQLIPTDPLSLAELVEDQSNSLSRHFLDHWKAFRFSDISFKLLVSCKNIAHSSAYSLHNAIIGHWHLLYAQRLSVGLKRVPWCFHSSNSHVEILDDPWWPLMIFHFKGTIWIFERNHQPCKDPFTVPPNLPVLTAPRSSSRAKPKRCRSPPVRTLPLQPWKWKSEVTGMSLVSNVQSDQLFFNVNIDMCI